MEWTPNELANALKNWLGNREQLLAAANMLQDQAKQIERLKEDISEYQQEIEQLRSDLEDCTCQGGHSEAYLKAKGKL
jgi:peptidoglycan hydrolase CwlO-like protein